MKTQLTIQQEKFAQKYAECGVGAEAYRFAYPKSKKWLDSAVWCNASKLLAIARVSQRVEELKRIAAEKAELKKDGKLKLLHEMLNVKVSDYYNGREPKDFSELTEAQHMCLKKFTETPTMYGVKTEIEIYDKLKIVEIHNKMCGHDAPTQIDLAVRAPKAMTQQEIEDEINRLENDI